ncbi:hypothetical protein AB1Y20_004065 [Prymnesium parvum]|uniref:Uncharacterized protein n=1 Tax=Prymnesium parvum TaxID=97485 RepID=A0AB34J6H7_PRYPA
MRWWLLAAFLHPPLSIGWASRAAPPLARPALPGRGAAPLMAQGDGKNKRRKKGRVTPPPPPPSAPEKPAAGRVDTQQLLSVRKQIALAKAYKALQEQGNAPKLKTRTSFRKTKPDLPKQGAVNYTAARDDEPPSEWALGPLPLLIVDGYNIIGLWPRLKKRRDKNDLDGARRLLLHDLVDFAQRRFDVVCVFDAAGAAEPKDKEDNFLGIRVVYACTSADEYIERESKRLQGERNVWAATNDNAVQVSARAHGANVVTSNWLIAELKGSRQATAAIVEEFNEREFRRTGGRSTLWDSVDSNTRRELEQMFPSSPKSVLSRKDREALEELERLKAAGLLQGRKPAMPPRRRKRKTTTPGTQDEAALDDIG